MKDKNCESSIEPTRSELEILQVLWKNGPSTVRFVNDFLKEHVRAVQYTSTLKLMQIMVEKKMLGRNEDQMKHVYTPLLEEKSTKEALIGRMVDTVFGGSKMDLVMQLFGNKKPSRKELEEIRALLQKINRNKS